MDTAAVLLIPLLLTSYFVFRIDRSLSLHTVRLSVIARTIEPYPAISTSFSCQLSNTLIWWPVPSPPKFRDCICEKPVLCGERCCFDGVDPPEDRVDMPLYLDRSIVESTR